MSTTTYRLFVQCSLGLETVLSQELASFGLKSESVEGGVELRVSPEELVRICLRSRAAESVRVRLRPFMAHNFGELEQQLKKLPFRAFFERATPVAVRVSCHKSKLWHSDAVAERALSVLREHVGCRTDEAAPEQQVQLVYLRLDNDEVQVSIDAGGLKMHQRGYRTLVERASLRETLAFALCSSALHLLPQDQRVNVWDPFCGAGTIGLELAHIKSGRVPGEHLRLSLQSWRGHDDEEFARILVELRRELSESPQVVGGRIASIICSDRSERAVATARKNAELAGLAHLRFVTGDVLSVAEQIEAGTTIICNPPYGKRLSECEGVKRLVSLLHDRKDLRPVAILTGGAARDLIPKTWPAILRFKNGGLSVSVRTSN